MQTIIRIDALDLSIMEGEQIAITGDNASGKTRLVEAVLGRNRYYGDTIHFDFSPSDRTRVSDNIKYISFQDAYGEAGGGYYHQLRWNQMEIDPETPVVGDVLERTAQLYDADKALQERLFSLFGLKPLLDKYVISLSSGELRKFQLTRALLAAPRVLILDNPFIGLDAPTRDSLSSLLSDLTKETDILIVAVMSRMDVVPEFVTHIVQVDGPEAGKKIPAAAYVPDKSFPDVEQSVLDMIRDIPQKDLCKERFYPSVPGSEIIRFNNISIRYGGRNILKDLSWTVREGECWAVSGRNGSGKSTLLSLMCADNPQAYACDMELFGHRRGTGESIWEIKRHIGYVSPEMHRGYQKNIPALDIVASGLFDTVGLYSRPDQEQLDLSCRWMRIFGIEALADRPFMKLSSGEQRLCLLARAFVKDPELLILDEPLHGLDASHCHKVRQIIDAFMRRPCKTLLMVTHYPSELPECISHSLVLPSVRD